MILGEGEISEIIKWNVQKVDGNGSIWLQMSLWSHCLRVKAKAKFLKRFIWKTNSNYFSDGHMNL